MDKGKERIGDYGTPEQEIPATGFGRGVDWESCMTMNDHWGYNKNDQNWKSTQTLIRNLIDCASKGGNYLLNVGPTAEGEFPQPSVERLAEIGKWMKVNGEAIYGTTASPFDKLTWGRCTQKKLAAATRGCICMSSIGPQRQAGGRGPCQQAHQGRAYWTAASRWR